MKTFSILAALLLSARWILAEETQSPLPLFISGSGKIVPFHNGQMLDDGRQYTMTAVPDRGNVFTNWQLVDVFTEVMYYQDYRGEIYTNMETTVVPLSPEPGKSRVLVFTMEPEQVLAQSPDFELTIGHGWRANFVPAPRKSRGQK